MPEAQARYFLGRVLLDLDRIDEGRQQMQLALKADPQFEPARDFLAVLESPPQPPAAGPVRAVAHEEIVKP